MTNLNLKHLYQDFMREKVDREYLQKYENVKVLGERFLGKYYIVVFEVNMEIIRKCINDLY